MATSSIFRNIILTEEKDVENFVNALEEAKENARYIPDDKYIDMSKEDMIKYFGVKK